MTAEPPTEVKTTVAQDAPQDVHPEPAPAEKAKMREDIRDAVSSTFLDRLIGKDKKAEAEPAKAEASEPTATEDPKPEPKPDPQPKPKKAKKAPEPKAITEEDMVRVATDAATRVAADVRQRDPVEKKAEPEPEVPEELARELPIYHKLAEMDPKKYGKVVSEFTSFSAKEKAYQKDWESKNPGETFNPEGPEHSEFFERNFPDVDAKDFDAAKETVMEERAAARAEERVAKRMEEKYGPDITRIQQERAMQFIESDIAATRKSAVTNILGAINEQYAPLAENGEKLATLKTADPVANDVAEEVYSVVDPLLVAVKRAHVRDAKGNFLFPLDNSKPIDQAVRKLVAMAESDISKFSRDDQADSDGRMFATIDDYVRMSPKEQAKHWYLDEANITQIVLNEAKKEARGRYDAKKEMYQRYAGKPYSPPGLVPKTSHSENGNAGDNDRKVLNRSVKPESPSVSGKPVTSPSNGDGNGEGDSVLGGFWNRMGLK